MHQEWDATPLIGSSARIIRGFSRIGIGAAVLTAVLGLAVTVSVALNDYKYATQWAGFPIAKTDLPDAPWLRSQRSDSTNPAAWGAIPAFDPSKPYEVVPTPRSGSGNQPGMFDDLIPSPKGRHLTDAEAGLAPPSRFNTEALSSAALTVLIGLGITAAASLAVLGFFSGLGWIIAGFARD